MVRGGRPPPPRKFDPPPTPSFFSFRGPPGPLFFSCTEPSHPLSFQRLPFCAFYTSQTHIIQPPKSGGSSADPPPPLFFAPAEPCPLFFQGEGGIELALRVAFNCRSTRDLAPNLFQSFSVSVFLELVWNIHEIAANIKVHFHEFSCKLISEKLNTLIQYHKLDKPLSYKNINTAHKLKRSTDWLSDYFLLFKETQLFHLVFFPGNLSILVSLI